MLQYQETVQDNLGVNTVMSLAGPSGLYMQSTVIVLVLVIVYGALDAYLARSVA